MLYGYARVSTAEQSIGMQVAALRQRGCERIFEDDGYSGTARSRPGLQSLLAALTAGDVLVVWKLDRLGRSLGHLIEIVEDLHRRGVGFVSLTESIDTTFPAGKLFFHLIGALAEFERSLIIERTNAGIAAAKAKGVHCGRPRSLSWEQVDEAKRMLADGKSQRQVARLFKVSDATLSRRLRA